MLQDVDLISYTIIDNHESGYLGMAKCFNVQGNLVVKINNVQLALIWFKVSNQLYQLLIIYGNYSFRKSSYNLPNHSCAQQVFEKLYPDCLILRFVLTM